jgi:hypothetical protein
MQCRTDCAGCPTCQPLLEGTQVTPQRRASMAAARVAKVSDPAQCLLAAMYATR